MRCIGIMTGNSLDAVDVVITDFSDDRINDVGSFSLPVPQAMAAEFRLLKIGIGNLVSRGILGMTNHFVI